jgi:hypothetical protein
MNLGSLDSLAKVKVDSRHPLIAQEEIHNARIARHFFCVETASTFLLPPRWLPFKSRWHRASLGWNSLPFKPKEGLNGLPSKETMIDDGWI